MNYIGGEDYTTDGSVGGAEGKHIYDYYAWGWYIHRAVGIWLYK